MNRCIAALTMGVGLLDATWCSAADVSSLNPIGPSTRALGVSGDGRVVVGRRTLGCCTTYAIRWTVESGVTELSGVFGGTYYSGESVSHNGADIAGEFHSSEYGGQGFRWTLNAGMVGIQWLPNGTSSFAHAVSGDGETVVGYCLVPGEYRAIRWTLTGGMLDLGPGYARGVSYDGSVVVGKSPDGAPWLWREAAGRVDFQLPPNVELLEPSALSANAQVFVGSARVTGVGMRAFRWTTEAGFELLGIVPRPGVQRSDALAVSADGSVIVGGSGPPEQTRAFVWTAESGMQDLRELLADTGADIEFWPLLEAATGVSADGSVIVGNGWHQLGKGPGWIAQLGSPCRADWNNDGGLTVGDIFGFLSCWFAGDLACANFNGDCCINVTDIFDYLTAWFAGCG